MASGLRSALARRVALPAILALAGFAVFSPSPAAAAPTPPQAASAASGWLASVMVDGNRLQDFGQDSVGLTIDAILGFASAGVEKDRIAAAMAWLTTPAVLEDYLLSFTSAHHAGETAKVILAIEVTGGDPTKVNGKDLVAELRSFEVSTGPSAGLFQNAATDDDTNAFDQALVILALARTPGGVPATAIDFLLSTECDSGGFPLFFTDPPTTCKGDADSSAMVTQALLAAGHGDDAADSVAWLVKQVDPTTGGVKPSFGGDPNTNTTGLVGEALRAFGEDATADKAAAFIIAAQVDCTGPASDRGAIALTQKVPGDDNTGFNEFSAPRATAQAILGLAGVPFGKITAVGARTGATPLCATATPTPPASTMHGAAGLPVTGSSLTPVLYTGGGLVVVGTVLLLVLRRRRDAGTL